MEESGTLRHLCLWEICLSEKAAGRLDAVFLDGPVHGSSDMGMEPPLQYRSGQSGRSGDLIDTDPGAGFFADQGEGSL